MILFRRTSDEAVLPVRSTEGAAGFDLYYSGDSTHLSPGEHAMFETDIQVTLENNQVGIIKPRSGWAAKYGLDVLAGVIDSDFQGTIKVILINHGQNAVYINHQDRIAQMIVTDFHSHMAETVHEPDEETTRGEGGFGSTGR